MIDRWSVPKVESNLVISAVYGCGNGLALASEEPFGSSRILGTSGKSNKIFSRVVRIPSCISCDALCFIMLPTLNPFKSHRMLAGKEATEVKSTPRTKSSSLLKE